MVSIKATVRQTDDVPMVLFQRTPRPSGGSLIPAQAGSSEDELPGGARDGGPTTGVIEPLNAAEIVWTAQHRELLSDLCDGYLDARTVGALFDRVQATWVASEDRPDPDPLVNAFGVALGDLVAQRQSGLTWCVYRDSAGTELVLARPGHSLVMFPVAAVAARWGSAPRGWFAPYVDEAAERAAAALAEPPDPA